ncbi:MAG: DNA-directed RNA polymerase subunit beta' [Pseudomonadota bacterium]
MALSESDATFQEPLRPMPNTPRFSAQGAASAALAISALKEPPRISSHGAIAARFLYSLRLIALHERAGRDPVPELAVRLGGVDIAAKALALSQAITSTWPENIHVSRFCCQFLTHDEATIASLIDRASQRDRPGFEEHVAGLIRPERIHRLWDGVLALVAAEAHAA